MLRWGTYTYMCFGRMSGEKNFDWLCDVLFCIFLNLVVQVKHVLATVDATVESELAQKYQVFFALKML